MPQSLARLHVHLVFSTKNRAPLITDDVRDRLHAYMGGIFKGLECPAIIINSVEDHVHILFDLARTLALSDVVEDVKKSSSKWVKTLGKEFDGFAWQAGYGAFGVSESKLEAVRTYIARQREHHSVRSFQEEYRELLKRHQIEFKEEYLWD